jgi:hypothetical protein
MTGSDLPSNPTRINLPPNPQKKKKKKFVLIHVSDASRL